MDTETRDQRLRRRADLTRLEARPTPWTDEQWREWASVKAAEIMDRGYAGPRLADGTYPMDYAFAVSGHMLTVGPGWNAVRRELGHRAADALEEVTP